MSIGCDFNKIQQEYSKGYMCEHPIPDWNPLP